MALVISTSIILAESDVTEDNPLIGYVNVATSSNLSTTTANADYPATNLVNPATHLLWKGTSIVADEYITIDLDGATDVDYIGIARHNFGTAGIEYAVETYDGATWTEVAAAIPANDTPIMVRFTKDSYEGVRIKLSPGTVVPQAAVVYAGELLVLPRRIYVGHTPMTMGRMTKKTVGQSEAGHYLGTVITGRSRKTSVSIENILPGWYRSNMDPFVEACEDAPFFFAWRPGTYPDEVGYAWLVGDVIPTNQRANGMMQVSLDLSGIV